jgi:NAD(P)-dependent dehydrogenase (short-subunit alcohol dehydrogenase family)
MAVYRVNEGAVIHETIDGETVVIDLSTGTYFSLRDSAAAIWSCVVTGATAESAAAALGERYDASAEVLRAAAAELLEELARENLVVSNAGVIESLPAAAEPVAERLPFTRPVLEKYTDMQDIILLDPVHHVDAATGWPNVVSAESS